MAELISKVQSAYGDLPFEKFLIEAKKLTRSTAAQTTVRMK